MVTEKLLPFKVKITTDEITSRGGLALFGEYGICRGVGEAVDQYLAEPRSGAGYRPSMYVVPLLLMLAGGGRALDDIREIRFDRGLRRILGLRLVPTAEAIGKWLRRTAKRGGLRGIAAVNRRLLDVVLDGDCREEYTLDIDATEIIADKKEAAWTYNKNKGYMPILGYLAENGFSVGYEFREGNIAPAWGNLEFLKYCEKQMPKGKKITAFRADAASYQADLLDYCEGEGIKFAVKAAMDRGVRDTISAISSSSWERSGDAEVAETVHTMEDSRYSFKLIVKRQPLKQKSLFDGDYLYFPVATNLDLEPGAVIEWYNRRGDASENRLKELKNDFGMEKMPCGQTAANAVFFAIGVLAYNLFVAFKLDVLPGGWAKYRAITVRWKFFNIPGKVVRHARETVLRVHREYYKMFVRFRRRTAIYATS